MKQSTALLTPPRMPKYSEPLQSGLYYVFARRANAEEPSDSSRALRAFSAHWEAVQWARKNLNDYTVASKA